ncbi:MAG: phenylalanine--tRNA ligase subunit beta [Thermoplasmata archaeon]|nr:phenylalanine--tRNA ligase subunit beta [Candidatus Sysuiplasma jiujiangense]
MPVIDLKLRDLVSLSGLDKDSEWFQSAIPMMGASFEGSEAGILRFEFFPNRPDHYSVEGVARSLKHLYGLSRPKVFAVNEGKVRMTVDDSVKNLRPVMLCGVVRNIVMDDGALKSLIDLQEKLHLTVGRRRKKVSIGIHDLDRVTPPFLFRAYGGKEISFEPLGMTDVMTPDEIVRRHEKGIEYGPLLGGGPYPCITDARGKVLSMPPIINGTVSALTEKTRNVLFDVNGVDTAVCSRVLNILCSALSERGGIIESAVVESGGSTERYPDMAFDHMTVPSSLVNSVTGLKFSQDRLADLLERMGYTVQNEKSAIVAGIPPYRMDIMHPVDIAEDAAIAYGYENFGNTQSKRQTNGTMLPATIFSNLIFELMAGYGYMQTVSFMLSSVRMQFGMMRLSEKDAVRLINPVTEDTEILRLSLLPGLLKLFEANKHNELPQRIYEIGDVHTPSRRKHLAALSIHPKATFSESKSLVDALLRDLKFGGEFIASTDERFIAGRQAEIHSGNKAIGIFGELHPEVITNFNLFNPVVGFELDVTELIKLR